MKRSPEYPPNSTSTTRQIRRVQELCEREEIHRKLYRQTALHSRKSALYLWRGALNCRQIRRVQKLCEEEEIHRKVYRQTALYSNKRSLYFRTRSPYSCNRALCSLERALYSRKRALYSRKGVLDSREAQRVKELRWEEEVHPKFKRQTALYSY